MDLVLATCYALKYAFVRLLPLLPGFLWIMFVSFFGHFIAIISAFVSGVCIVLGPTFFLSRIKGKLSVSLTGQLFTVLLLCIQPSKFNPQSFAGMD